VDPNHQEMLELHTRVNSHEPWVKFVRFMKNEDDNICTLISHHEN
jgi:hypothetical protein